MSWLHIVWIAPAFTIFGFICCAILTGGKLEEVETELYRERQDRRNQCDRCEERLRAEAAEADKKALSEELETATRRDTQRLALINKLQARLWRQTP